MLSIENDQVNKERKMTEGWGGQEQIGKHMDKLVSMNRAQNCYQEARENTAVLGSAPVGVGLLHCKVKYILGTEKLSM